MSSAEGATVATDSHQRTFPHWRTNLRVLWIAQMLAMMGMGAFLPFLPLYVRQLGHLSPAQAQWWSGLIIAAPFLTAILATPLWGNIADRFGRKLVVIRAALGLGITVFLMGLAETVQQLLLLRLLQGLLSGFIAANIGFVSAETPPHRVGYALGMLQSATAAGSILGPLLGGIASDLLGIRWTFIAVALLCLLSAALVWRYVREHYPPNPAALRPSLWAPFAFALRSSRILALLGVILISQAAMMTIAPVLPLYLEQLHAPRQLLSTLTGIAAASAGVAIAIASPLWARSGEQRGAHWVLLTGSALASLLYAAQALAPHYGVLLLLRAATGVAVAGLLPTLYALLNRQAPESLRSSIMALGSSATLLGNLLGPLLGSTVAIRLGMEWSFLAAALLMGMVSLTLWTAPRTALHGLQRFLSRHR